MFVIMLLKVYSIFLAVASVQGYRFEDRIIGGTTAKISEVPYQISLHIKGQHICGGSIIGWRHVLTAAHCVHNQLARDMYVNAGGSYYSLPLQKLQVNRHKIHGKYNRTTYDNDIAIIEVETKFNFGPNILPIALPNDEIRDGTIGLISGWGRQQETQQMISLILRKVTVPVINRADCQKLYFKKDITNNMICAGYIQGGKDACQGDSGGPFVANGKLYGITSWGIGCGRPKYPGVYTNVSKYRDWIRLNTNI